MEEQITAQDWLNSAYTIMEISFQIGATSYPLLAGLALLKAVFMSF